MLILCRLEPILCSSYAVLAHLELSYSRLGVSWATFGLLLASLQLQKHCKIQYFAVFFQCFRHAGTYAFGSLLVLSWAAFWGLVGCLFASLRPLELPYGLSWASLGPILSHFGGFLGLSWRLLCLSWPFLGHLWPTCALGGLLWLTGALIQAFLGLSCALFRAPLGLSWCHFGLHVAFFWLSEGSPGASGVIFSLTGVERAGSSHTSHFIFSRALCVAVRPHTLQLAADFGKLSRTYSYLILLKPVQTITQGD